MGIDWMKHREITQAVPPAYAEFIGRQILSSVARCSSVAGEHGAAADDHRAIDNPSVPETPVTRFIQKA